MNPSTGDLSGIVGEDTGVFEGVTLTVTDSKGLSASTTFDINITEPNIDFKTHVKDGYGPNLSDAHEHLIFWLDASNIDRFQNVNIQGGD